MTRTTITAVLTTATLSLTACAGGSEHNDADVNFAQDMIPHHAQAVEMSDLLLAKDGVDPDVADLAEQIKASQGPEIETMSGWLEDWEEDVPSTDMDMGDMGQMDGMMSPDEMRELEDAAPADASRLFLEQMTEHHEGAIEMAGLEVEDGSSPEAIELAESIVESQQAEVERMDDLLSDL
ncbi:MAG: DUF305 domain-containing protein [Actinomycetota bacterium]|nr:DUF305 domain-containing protein [Actinomycetota bacterium]